MGFASFLGRVLFASVFILSAYQEFHEFGMDDGTSTKTFKPKYDAARNHVSYYLGTQVPDIEMKHAIAATIALRGLGGTLFIFGSSFGAYLLLLYLVFVTPIVHDFYNYDIEKPEFALLFVSFTVNLALLGSLIFFLGMKISIPKRQTKKKTPKTKTY